MLDWPLWQTIVALWVIVFLRTNATYWLGRGITFGASRTRFVKVVDGPVMAKAQRFMNRWGVLAVPLSYLTIGVQTAVHLTAGVTRMPLRRYLPGVVVGALMWAVLYGTIGLAAFWAAILAASRVGWPIVVAVLAVIVAFVGYLRHYRKKHPERFVKAEALAAGEPYHEPSRPDHPDLERESLRPRSAADHDPADHDPADHDPAAHEAVHHHPARHDAPNR